MDKTVLITGASRGLGAALAAALAPTHHVIAVGKTVGALEDLDDTIKAAGGQATLAPMDIGTDEAMQQLCRSIFDRWGKLDLWLHTAIHAAPLSPAGHIGPKDLSKSIDINVTAAARLISYVGPLLRRKPPKSPLPKAGRSRPKRPDQRCKSSPQNRCPPRHAPAFSRAKIARH